MHDLLTTTETARVLDVSDRMVHHYVRTGRLTPSRRIGRNNLFDPVAVAELRLTLVRRQSKGAA